jgi:tight adherence protein C
MIVTLAAALVSTSLLTKLAIFGCVAAGAWIAMEFFAGQSSRAEERLEEIHDSRSRRGDDPRLAKRGDMMTRLLERATPQLAKPLQPKNQVDVNKLRDRLNHAGFRSETAPSVFLGLKAICLVVGFVGGGGIMLFTHGMTQTAIMSTVSIAGVMFYLPSVIVWFCKRNRQDNIFFGLPDALDLMVVCVEAGLGLDQAMRRVSDEMKKTYVVIAEEFALCNLQLQMGRARNEVLHELGARTGVDDLKALSAILIQADKFGSSVAQALRVQSDSMRVRRRQMAEEKAAKTAVKLIFPLVLFIFPAIFIVLVGPAAITMINEMFPAMSGGK